jgi:hypothetical protein
MTKAARINHPLRLTASIGQIKALWRKIFFHHPNASHELNRAIVLAQLCVKDPTSATLPLMTPPLRAPPEILPRFASNESKTQSAGALDNLMARTVAGAPPETHKDKVHHQLNRLAFGRIDRMPP